MLHDNREEFKRLLEGVSEQALYHNLYVTCDNIELITAQEIINVIESEYEMSKHLSQLIKVARKQYESIKH